MNCSHQFVRRCLLLFTVAIAKVFAFAQQWVMDDIAEDNEGGVFSGIFGAILTLGLIWLLGTLFGSNENKTNNTKHNIKNEKSTSENWRRTEKKATSLNEDKVVTTSSVSKNTTTDTITNIHHNIVEKEHISKHEITPAKIITSVHYQATRAEILDACVDEYGVKYTRDYKKLISAGKLKSNSYRVKDGVEIICNYAFSKCKDLREILLPSTLYYIGKSAFQGCIKLDYIYLPKSLVFLCDRSLDCECYGLFEEKRKKPINITIPPSVVIIDGNPFCYNSIIQSDNERFKVIDNVLYTTDGKVLISYCSLKEDFVVPHEVERIGVGAFRDTPIIRVSLPESLKIIDKEAFKNAEGLEYMTFPYSLEEIRDEAFEWCSFKCNIVKLPPKLEVIGKEAFDYDGTIKIIQIPKGSLNHFMSLLPDMSYTKLYEEEIIIEDNLCLNHDKTEVLNAVEEAEDYIIPEGIIKIHKSAFCYIEEVNTIKLPTTLKSIPPKLFDVDTTEINRILVPKEMKEYYLDTLKDYQDAIEVY